MKTKYSLLVLLFLSSFFSACAGPFSNDSKVTQKSWIMPDSLICEELGSGITETLFSPKSVKCYHLLGKAKIEEKEVQLVKGFVRDQQLVSPNSSQIAVLQYMFLGDERNYKRDTVQISAPFVPVLEFEFIGRNKRSASVVISQSDLSWVLIYDGKQQFHYDFVNVQLMNRFCNFFINTYIKNKD